jgi:three-Cys-motif partner protein
MSKLKDRWPELCKMVESDDGLPTRDAGEWTEDKLYFWNRYIDITTRAMVDSPKWPGGLVYVDLFAGPGVCKINETGRRFPGSVLIAANAPRPFRKILACDTSKKCVQACLARIRRTRAADRTLVFEGDCNTKIDEIVAEIPEQSLTLAFIDPEGLHVHFDTIRRLSHDRPVDLLVLFADGMDIVRNVATYAKQTHSKLDDTLGPDCDWRRHWGNLANQSAQNVCELFTSLYTRQLEKHLEYVAFGHKTMRWQQVRLYRLIYASKHPLGLEFWNKITGKDRRGQKRLF